VRDVEVGVELRVQAVDTRQDRLRDLDRRGVALAIGVEKVGRWEAAEGIVGHGRLQFGLTVM
jgi:hypothetical protein